MADIPTQMTMFGVPAQKSGDFNIYHDESGTDLEHGRFYMHGNLIVPASGLEEAYKCLSDARKGYKGKIHFVKLRDNTNSQMPEIAKEWLSLFFSTISNNCFYKCLIVDMQSSKFDRDLLVHPAILYNRTALNSIYGNITWALKKYDVINVSIFSEAMTRADDDNFEEYIPRELARRAGKNRKCPKVIIPSERVTTVKGNPQQVEECFLKDCEFIQLVDVITGAVGQAINAKASQNIKIDLGILIAKSIGDIRLAPWLQQKNLHRRFSVSCFDGKNGYSEVQLKILSKDQLRFMNI